jgi:pimeloyl-ACP methyl ester carboxylesterase
MRSLLRFLVRSVRGLFRTPVPVSGLDPIDFTPAQELCYSSNLARSVDPSSVSLDLYRTNSPSPRGVVIFLHGGGLRSGNKRHIGFKKSFFLAQGFHFISINYPLLEPHSSGVIELQLEALNDLTVWLKNELPLQCTPPVVPAYVAIGHSAGAYLVAMAIAKGSLGSLVDKVILVDSASYDLETRYHNGRPPVQAEIMRLLSPVSASIRSIDSLLQAYSPVVLFRHNRSRSSRPISFLFCTTKKPGSVRSTRALMASMAGEPCYTSLHHSYGLDHLAINKLIGHPTEEISHHIKEFLASA